MTTMLDPQRSAFQGTSSSLPRIPSNLGHRSCVSLLPISTYISSDYELLVLGRPRLEGASIADNRFHEAFIDSYETDFDACVRRLSGRFAIALRHLADSSLFLAIDRFATVPVFFAQIGDEYVFAESATLLPNALRKDDRISKQAIFNYLYFHMIPAPGSIYRDVSKMLPATYLILKPGRQESGTYWQPEFEESRSIPFGIQAQDLHVSLERAVAGSISGSGNEVGCFLSGGLDSSTVLGYLARVTKSSARAFTIGFEADDYDETAFAQAAAEHFDAELNVYRMTPSDLQAAVLDIAHAYDEPFGNSSALPTLFCARLASSHGVRKLLAGDGGDELFAGNARYAKQKVFDSYYKIPATIRRLCLDRLGADTSRLKDIAGLRKLHSYVRQALIPLPDRLESYNHLHRYPIDQIFTDEFLGDVDITEPLMLLRNRYREPEDATALNRMLYLDWKFTLSDNDLRKVTRMCEAAGVQVEFPMLEDRLVDFSTKVPSTRKLRGTYLRYFYRKSMRGFLPAAVLKKRKHGFGLPFGIWLAQDPDLRSFTYDALSRLEKRDFFESRFIAELKAATEKKHAAYYGTMIWVMMMLEIWLSEHH